MEAGLCSRGCQIMSEPKGERPGRRNANRATGNGGMGFSRGLFGGFLFLALCAAPFLLLKSRGGKYITPQYGQGLNKVKTAMANRCRCRTISSRGRSKIQ